MTVTLQMIKNSTHQAPVDVDVSEDKDQRLDIFADTAASANKYFHASSTKTQVRK
jgi:hypothetical protein